MDQETVAYASRLQAPDTLKEAMIYSLEAGGKRIRPLLLFATLHAFGREQAAGLATACALEMIHTYSLIHDDLPSMDNDDLRRGKPTNHKVFGEAMAILAGDGLLTYAFQVIAEDAHPLVTARMKLRLLSELAKAAGPEGMVAGQVADMEGERRQLSLAELEAVHVRKTGRLLEFAVLAGAILAEASDEQTEKLLIFARNLGLAFQIRDDILDVEGTEEEIGKPVGSDISNEKSTYVSLLGLEESKAVLQQLTAQAKEAVASLGLQDEFLLAICDVVANRKS
ncbi:polyprenyl synthetase family protein [Ectobacillus sp. SYSU M60031]|uniref:Farnesyl diphosphate synthase n=2 Tax=Ectobacillus ponti TaxID=2961894 RepID=A0AA42BN29_9BACI|nr:farnesyl diphosphate synthase [Ectobacillus ponti]MCP8967046.1 polyprenyl synthetase family protein [Ectobacillus ponti]